MYKTLDSEENEIDIEQYSKHITQEIEEMLQSKGYKVENPTSKKIIKYFYTFLAYIS